VDDASRQDLTPGPSKVSEYGVRMAELARSLRSQRTSLTTLQAIVTATSEMVKNCDDVAISLSRPDGTVETRASMGAGLVEQADQLQMQCGEGPCLDTAWDVPLVMANDLPHDGAWPRWAPSVVNQLGVRSLICVQLFTNENHQLGVLQLLSQRPDAFESDAADEVLGIAANAAVALGAMAAHEAAQFGLVRRTLIGQATGILMERYQLDQHQAYEVLRRTSQEVGRKVHDIAADVVDGTETSGL
jgi:GAF domain-containing protein